MGVMSLRLPTQHAQDGGDSAPFQAESTPEVLSTLQAGFYARPAPVKQTVSRLGGKMSLWEEMDKRQKWLESLPDGVPCDHVGCLQHVSHPCEVCGRVAGRRLTMRAADVCPHGGVHVWMASEYVENVVWCGKCGTRR